MDGIEGWGNPVFVRGLMGKFLESLFQRDAGAVEPGSTSFFGDALAPALHPTGLPSKENSQKVLVTDTS